jgi:hypothetical protein
MSEYGLPNLFIEKNGLPNPTHTDAASKALLSKTY